MWFTATGRRALGRLAEVPAGPCTALTMEAPSVRWFDRKQPLHGLVAGIYDRRLGNIVDLPAGQPERLGDLRRAAAG